MQVLFETDDLATALWAELLAVLLRYKRRPPRFPPYFKDKWKDGKKIASKGSGGFVRGACLVKPTLGPEELKFIQDALPLLEADNVMCAPRPAAKCLTKELVAELRAKLIKGIKDVPDCVDNHLHNVCFKCGGAGHMSRFCPKIYGKGCMDWGVPDMVKGQEERETQFHKALEKQTKEKEKQTKEKKQTKQKKEKKEKKKVTEGCWSSFPS